MKKWFNVELNERDAVKMKAFLTEKGIKFETSGCFELVHFEILLEKDSSEYKAVNTKLERLWNDAIFAA